MLTSEQKKNFESGKGFTPRSPQSKPQQGQPPAAQLLALPDQTKVLLHHALTQTKAQMAQVDQIWAQSEATVLSYFDEQEKQSKQRIATEIMGRMGVSADFFDDQPLDIQGAFESLMAPVALSPAIEVPVLPGVPA
jgi:hypothetical protein